MCSRRWGSQTLVDGADGSVDNGIQPALFVALVGDSATLTGVVTQYAIMNNWIDHAERDVTLYGGQPMKNISYDEMSHFGAAYTVLDFASSTAKPELFFSANSNRQQRAARQSTRERRGRGVAPTPRLRRG